MAGLSDSDRTEVLAAVQKKISRFPRDHPPVEMARDIHALVRARAGVMDPYAVIKSESNEACQSSMPMLEQRVARACDPLSAALKLAIAGNILDFGAYSATHVLYRDVTEIAETVLAQPLSGDDPDTVRKVVQEAKVILYVGDNAGECFFDRLLLERLPLAKLTYAVRGGPILNDATLEDARAAGIQNVCTLIDTGDQAPGVVLKDCSRQFQNAFELSDVVIAKGQGNYESLSGRSDRTYVFVTKVKCEVLAKDIGFAVGSNVVRVMRPEPGAGTSAETHNKKAKMEVQHA